MKKVLTTTFCAAIIFMGTQMTMAADSNTKYTKTNTQSVSEKKGSQNYGQQRMQKPPMPNLEEELNLTEEQKQQARQNRINGRKQMKPTMDELRAKKDEVLDIIDSELSDDIKKEKLQKLQSEIKTLHKKANELRESNMKEFEKILTSEQKTKFEQLKKKNNPSQGCQKCKMMPPPPPMDEE